VLNWTASATQSWTTLSPAGKSGSRGERHGYSIYQYQCRDPASRLHNDTVSFTAGTVNVTTAGDLKCDRTNDDFKVGSNPSRLSVIVDGVEYKCLRHSVGGGLQAHLDASSHRLGNQGGAIFSNRGTTPR